MKVFQVDGVSHAGPELIPFGTAEFFHRVSGNMNLCDDADCRLIFGKIQLLLLIIVFQDRAKTSEQNKVFTYCGT